MKILKNRLMLAVGIFVLLCAFKLANVKSELIKWESKTHDFGLIEKDVAVNQIFFFTNEGEAPIQIIKTKTSCGCTVSKHSQGEISNGERGFVQAEYNAVKSGVFSKTISVYTSLSEVPMQLKIKGEVK